MRELDQAIAELTTEIDMLIAARDRLLEQRDARRKRAPKHPQPVIVAGSPDDTGNS